MGCQDGAAAEPGTLNPGSICLLGSFSLIFIFLFFVFYYYLYYFVFRHVTKRRNSLNATCRVKAAGASYTHTLYYTLYIIYYFYIIFQSVLPGHAAVALCQDVSAVSLAARPRLGFQVWTENLLSSAVWSGTSRSPPACCAASERSSSCLDATVKKRGEERSGGHARNCGVFPHIERLLRTSDAAPQPQPQPGSTTAAVPAAAPAGLGGGGGPPAEEERPDPALPRPAG